MRRRASERGLSCEDAGSKLPRLRFGGELSPTALTKPPASFLRNAAVVAGGMSCGVTAATEAHGTDDTDDGPERTATGRIIIKTAREMKGGGWRTGR